MFKGSGSSEETVIGEGLKIEGKVIADGLVRVNGKIAGDLRCASLIISDTAEICGTVSADSVVVDGMVEGPIRGKDIVLRSNAHVTGDIHHTSLTIEKGAMFDGRSKQAVKDDKTSALPKRGKQKKGASAANDDVPKVETAA